MFTLGASQSFDALLYGEDHPSTIGYLQNQYAGVSNTLSSASRAIYEKAKSTFEYFTSHEAMRFARAALAGAKGIFETARITTLWDIKEMQGASSVMQRWIMANPNVRNMYHLQKLEGYAESYTDFHPGDIGENHYDYRRVMDGMFIFHDEGKYDWEIKHYLDELIEGDRDLIFEEKCEITTTWNAMDVLLALGSDKDPTSPSGASL